MTELLRDFDTEKALLGGLALAPGFAPKLLAEESLREEHFSQTGHAEAFRVLVEMADRGEHPDELTLAAAIENTTVPNPRAFVADMFAALPDLGSMRGYARRIRDLHHRRQMKLASALISQAADLGDMTKLAEAEGLLTAPVDAEASTWTPEQLRERFADRLDAPAPERYSWPFQAMDRWTGGGLRRKQVVLIGGWTSNGKSVLYDQILERLSEQGLRCHSYINEMSEEERMDRAMARLSGVPFERIYARDLTPEQDVQVRLALPRMSVGMTECAGWTAEEIARHIRWNRWDVAGVDIVHEIEHHDERELAEVARVLRTTAKSVGCILVACVHLNDQRVTSPQRPVPVLRDVRGTGMLTRGADVVLFIHREDDEDGVPAPDGVLFAAKIRNGQPATMRVRFQPDRMRFLPVRRDLEAVA
jgi:replicative DNA helicase